MITRELKIRALTYLLVDELNKYMLKNPKAGMDIHYLLNELMGLETKLENKDD